LDTYFHISNCSSCSLSQTILYNTSREKKRERKRERERDMTQIMWLLWWPKNTTITTTTKGGCEHSDTATTTATTTTTTTATITNTTTTAVSATCLAHNASSSHCSCLTKLVKKLKRHSRSLRGTSRQSSFQCRYDPLSYSLNFDSTGSGSLLDEDYHHFYSFSSRFVANPRTSCPVATSH
jgi:hypothetical protein